MTIPLVLCALVASTDIPFPKLPTPMRDVDNRIRRLYDNDVRKDKKRLAAALDDIWKMLPALDPKYEAQKKELAGHLVLFITLDAPVADPREGQVSRNTGSPVKNMLIHIGLPAVPALLFQLWIPFPDTEDALRHRRAVASCLVEIYDKGGDGRRMAVERIKMYAERLSPEEKQRILSALEFNALKPSPPPAGRQPGK